MPLIHQPHAKVRIQVIHHGHRWKATLRIDGRQVNTFDNELWNEALARAVEDAIKRVGISGDVTVGFGVQLLIPKQVQ